ncbi:hypothetical protein ACFYVL_44330 [Streptomyces sp. NPDC004111]|uniref:hypothetical protein n=1 Tax=Streptomyces sp. NPDC004111 TaxID=3364690 RepID=UPI0036C73432
MSDFIHDKAQELMDAKENGDPQRMAEVFREVLEESTGTLTERLQAVTAAVEDNKTR